MPSPSPRTWRCASRIATSRPPSGTAITLISLGPILPGRVAEGDVDELTAEDGDFSFVRWVAYARTTDDFDMQNLFQTATARELSTAELEGYAAPFPDEAHLVPAVWSPRTRRRTQSRITTSSAGNGGPSRRALRSLCAARRPFGNSSPGSHRHAATIARTMVRQSRSSARSTFG